MFPPANRRTPGVDQRVRPQKRQGALQPLPARVLLIGARSSANNSHDYEPTRMQTEPEAQSFSGAGSQVALMVTAAFGAGRFVADESGALPEVWAMAIPPPTNGVRSVHRRPVTGTATLSGDLVVTIAGRTVRAFVEAGDTEADMAAALGDAIRAVEPNLPVTSAAAGNAITITARENGICGEWVLIERDASGVAGVTIDGQSVTAGAGVTDLETALDVSLETDWDAIVLPQQDAVTRTQLKQHIEAAWRYDHERYRIAVVGVSGTVGEAQTFASGIDDYRIVVVNAERLAALPRVSSPSLPYEAAAEVATRLFSQSKPNANFNLKPLATPGRRRALLPTIENDAIMAGVTVLGPARELTAGGVLVRPVSTAITDQTGETDAPDTRWQPIEIAKTVAALARQMGLALVRFSKGIDEGRRTEENRISARQSAITVLTAAVRQGWIAPFPKSGVQAAYKDVGGSARLCLDLSYSVIVATDIVAVTHNVVR